MRQRIVVCRDSSESRVFALPLISGDRCSLTIAKALRTRRLTTILLLHFRETSRRINIEIVTIFRFSVSVLSPARTTTASRLPQSQQVDLNPRTIPRLGGLQTSHTLTASSQAVPGAGKGVFPPLFYWGELVQRDKVTCRRSQRGCLPTYSEFQPQNFPLYPGTAAEE